MRYSPSRGWLAAAIVWLLFNLYPAGGVWADHHGASVLYGMLIVLLGAGFWAVVLRFGYMLAFRRGPWLFRRTFFSPWFPFLIGLFALLIIPSQSR